MGLSETHIIAVMANIYAESRYSATNAQDRYGYDGLYNTEYIFQVSDDVGYGILQWTHYSRKEGLQNMADEMGKEVSDLDLQLAYFQYEMEDPQGGCNNAWNNFLNKAELEEATTCFFNEIEIAKENSLQQRIDCAHTIENWYSGLNN